MTCRVVFFSDLHLQKLYRFWPNHLERQYRAIRKPFLYCLDNHIKNVIIGGDISEDPFLSGPAMTLLLRILNEFDSKINIHIILGNHDFASTEENSLGPLIELCAGGKYKSVRVYDKPTAVQIDGIWFNMLPYPHGQAEKPYTDGPSVNVAHLEWEGAVRDNLKSRIKGGYQQGDGSDFWLIGHLHTRQYLPKHRVLYCGTLYQTNFGENEDKSFCDLSFRMNGGKLQAKWVDVPANPGFTLKNQRINSLKDLTKLTKDPSVQYRLLVAEGVKIPRDLQLEFSNIRTILGQKEQVAPSTQELPTVRPTIGLGKWLANYGLDKQQRIRAREIVKQLGE